LARACGSPLGAGLLGADGAGSVLAGGRPPDVALAQPAAPAARHKAAAAVQSTLAEPGNVLTTSWITTRTGR
jgi:hypothetical protein